MASSKISCCMSLTSFPSVCVETQESDCYCLQLNDTRTIMSVKKIL